MKKTIFTGALALVFMGTAKAQSSDTATDNHTIGITIPAVILMDIEPAASKNITMAFAAPTEAGEGLSLPTSNTSLWLNYSYIPSIALKTAKISVLTSDVIAGVNINLTAGTSATSGAGSKGNPSSMLTLSNVSQDIITSIGASYTGTGATNGHNLTYSLEVLDTNYGNLVATASTSITVTYTITE